MWGREGVGIRGRVCVSVLTAGLVYHKPPSCQYYDRSRWDTVSFAQGFLGRGTTPDPKGRKGRKGRTRTSSKCQAVGGSRSIAVREQVSG